MTSTESFDSSDLKDLIPNSLESLRWNPEPLSSMTKSCLVVLDSSVMISPYELAAESLAVIQQTLLRLRDQDRLRIPEHSLREFLARRPQKVADILKKLTDKESEVPGFSPLHAPLLEPLNEYQDLVNTQQQIKDLGKTFHKQVQALAAAILEWEWSDPLSVFYRDLISDAMVIDTALSDAEIVADFAVRCEKNIPPGIKDKNKKSNAHGDLIIWMSILEEAARSQSSCLLITNDMKQDWWQLSGKRPMSPRFELVEEYRRASGGKDFRLASLSGFLESMGVRQEVVREVRHSERDSPELLTINEVRELWPQIVNYANGINRRIGQLLQSTTPISISGNTVTIESPYEFHSNRLASDEVTAVVEECATMVLERPITIHVKRSLSPVVDFGEVPF